MLGLGIILAHLCGDYIFQDDQMAAKKTTSWRWAIYHAATYTAAYAILFAVAGLYNGWLSVWALAIIGGTHLVIDRFRLAKQLIWARNQLLPKKYRYSWATAKANAGYSEGKPAWMSTWLMIIVDNSIHLGINALAIYLLVA